MSGIITTALKHMLAAGMDSDAIIAAVADMEAQIVPYKSKAAIRQARYLERKKASQMTESDACDETPSPQSPPLKAPPDPLKITPPLTPQPELLEARAQKFALPAWIPAEPWAGWEEMRKRIRKPLTDRARTLAIAKLNELKDAGWPPGDVLNHCTMNSYQGIFPPRDNQNGQRSSSQDRYADRMRDPILDDIATGRDSGVARPRSAGAQLDL